MFEELFWLVLFYVVVTAANTGYRVLRYGESVSEALGHSSRWPVDASLYFVKWWKNRFKK